MAMNHPKERIQHLEHGKSLKSRRSVMLATLSQINLYDIHPEASLLLPLCMASHPEKTVKEKVVSCHILKRQ